MTALERLTDRQRRFVLAFVDNPKDRAGAAGAAGCVGDLKEWARRLMANPWVPAAIREEMSARRGEPASAQRAYTPPSQAVFQGYRPSSPRFTAPVAAPVFAPAELATEPEQPPSGPVARSAQPERAAVDENPKMDNLSNLLAPEPEQPLRAL